MILYVSHDDATRTVATRDETGTLIPSTPEAPNPRPYTPQENAATDARLAQSALLTDLEARISRIEAHLWPAPPDPTTPTSPGVKTLAEHGGVWPVEGLLREGDTVYRNISGVPLTSAPSMFPGSISQWGHLFVTVLAPTAPDPDPDPQWPQWRGEWSATADYLVGDHVTRGGVVYRCLAAHGAAHAGTWGPPTTGVWTVATAP